MKCNGGILCAALIGLSAWLLVDQLGRIVRQDRLRKLKTFNRHATHTWEGEGGAIVHPETTRP